MGVWRGGAQRGSMCEREREREREEEREKTREIEAGIKSFWHQRLLSALA